MDFFKKNKWSEKLKYLLLILVELKCIHIEELFMNENLNIFLLKITNIGTNHYKSHELICFSQDIKKMS